MSNVSVYARGGQAQLLAPEPGYSLVTRLPGSPCATEKTTSGNYYRMCRGKGSLAWMALQVHFKN